MVALALFEGALATGFLAAVWGAVFEVDHGQRRGLSIAVSMCLLNLPLVWVPLAAPWVHTKIPQYDALWAVCGAACLAYAMWMYRTARKVAAGAHVRA